MEKYHNITMRSTPRKRRRRTPTSNGLPTKSGEQHRVRVATSDGPEQVIILGHGALRLSASAFHEEMAEVRKQIGDAVRQNNQKNGKNGAVRAAMEKAKEGGSC